MAMNGDDIEVSLASYLSANTNARLLDQTIRYHGERAHSFCGVSSLELWIVVQGRDDPERTKIDDDDDPLRTEGTGRMMRPILGSWHATGQPELDERETRILWKEHCSSLRNCPNPRIRWHRWTAIRGGSNDRTTTTTTSSSSSIHPPHWIVSIRFEASVPIAYEGMVCWMLPKSTPSRSKQDMLVCSTDHIATTYALRFLTQNIPDRLPIGTSTITIGTPARRHGASRKRMPPDLCYNDDHLDCEPMSEHEIHGIMEIDNGMEEGRNEISNKGEQRCLLSFGKSIRAYFVKLKGGGHDPPQPLCWRQTLFVFVGTFVAIVTIDRFNTLLTLETYNSERDGNESEFTALQMGPFGASTLLIFGLTTAAPSQPRSLICGALIGMVVGKLISMVPVLPLGVRMALATSFTGTIMAGTGTTYPPGGALAIVFSSQVLGWDKIVLQMSGTALLIILGVLMNNLHPRRRYPTFWWGKLEEYPCYKKKDKNENGKNHRNER